MAQQPTWSNERLIDFGCRAVDGADDLERKEVAQHPIREVPTELDILHRWMLVPLTLWPLNIHDIFCSCLDTVEAGKPLDPDMLFLLQSLSEPPSEKVCQVVAEHEHLVQKGNYESLINIQAKFDSIEREAKRLKLKSDACHAFLCKGLGLVETTDPKRLARLRREFSIPDGNKCVTWRDGRRAVPCFPFIPIFFFHLIFFGCKMQSC